MKKSTVTISGLSRVQANVLAILFEDGEDICNLINEKLEKMELENEMLDNCFQVDFDEDDEIVHHQVEI